MRQNSDLEKSVIKDFGSEWSKFNHDSELRDEGLFESMFNQYFKLFPFNELSEDSVGFDLGAGTGRWARYMVSRVGHLNCIEPSDMARIQLERNLSNFENVSILNHLSTDNFLEEESQDFGYCLGVLHHTINPLQGLISCQRSLKAGAPFLVYLYYNFENRSFAFRWIWKLSNALRAIVCRLPKNIKHVVCEIIAMVIYYPLARTSYILNNLEININLPLSFYKDKSFYMMRTDALDRFGTKLEKRYSKNDIRNLLEEAGFDRIKFSSEEPFWVALAYKAGL